jgi:hypothetical protein
MTQEEINDIARARCSAIAYMREQGMTFDAIGKKCGISHSRANQMYKKHERNMQYALRAVHRQKLIELLTPII